MTAEWREDLDALQFVAGRGGSCFVHRLAFRTLLGFPPDRADCLAFFADHGSAFRAAAADKAARCPTVEHRNFHLTSRDVARRLGKPPARHGETSCAS